ncbi:hypothetical protein FACS189434_03620 [Bacteroidia bacterium]|nr:hypothetical protein FACS189434_03620 [Bacteroidia bacterium]
MTNQARIGEAEGTSGTGRIGKGPVYAEKQERYLETKKNWENVQSEYNSLQTKIGQLSINPTQSNSTTSEEENIDGVEARVKALYQLSGLHWFITLLFILIECLPVITKLMNKRGSYDETLERIEYEKMIEQKEIISRKNSEINELLRQSEDAAKLNAEVKMKAEKYKLDAELQGNKAILDDIAKKQQELAKIAIDKWYKEEKDKLKTSPVSTNTTTQTT